MSFVHLHVHSCYSSLDGIIKIKDLIDTAKRMDMLAVALTDHGHMFGTMSFYKAACEVGVKPILGVEAYVVQSDLKKREPGEQRHHLVLLAENMEGYRNLCRLVSLANSKGFYYKPRMDKELLRRYSNGIIALSGCILGELPWLILNCGRAEAELAAQEYAAIFKDRFYLELQSNGLPEQEKVNRGLVEVARNVGLPLVTTNDCHYILKEHHKVHDVLLCIQSGKTVNDKQRLRFTTREFYFKSPAEMTAAFKEYPEALANTLTIAKRCNVEFAEKPGYTFPPAIDHMTSKAVICAVGRALGFTSGEVDKIAELVPDRRNITLEALMKAEPQFRMAIQGDPKAAKLLEYALLLDGLPYPVSVQMARDSGR